MIEKVRRPVHEQPDLFQRAHRCAHRLFDAVIHRRKQTLNGVGMADMTSETDPPALLQFKQDTVAIRAGVRDGFPIRSRPASRGFCSLAMLTSTLMCSGTATVSGVAGVSVSSASSDAIRARGTT